MVCYQQNSMQEKSHKGWHKNAIVAIELDSSLVTRFIYLNTMRQGIFLVLVSLVLK
jgi:hypothetical protein